MALRLGELLVYNRAISEEQLERALNAQRVHGGHLGTCLIELGYVDHNCLAATLAQARGVDYAQSELFDSIAGDIIGTVPKRVVEQHQVVPFGLQDARLYVAMIDPKDFKGIDEISIAAGRRIRAFISPEITILRAMERYYAIPRQPRFALADALEQAIADAHDREPEAARGASRNSMHVHWVKRRNKGQAEARNSVWCLCSSSR